MKGQIIKIISNLYFVSVYDKVYECKSRGLFRNKKITPVVGDFCIISDQNYILDILPRKNFLIRPLVSNIDQGLIVTSLKTPMFSTNLLDKLILIMEINKIEPIICITKEDLISDKEKEEYRNILSYYEKIGYKVYYNTELDELKKIFKDKTTVFTGQTGAGKSTLLNKLNKKLNLETKPISEALNRGVHTTRHTEIYQIKNMYFVDTPGFSSLDLKNITKEELKNTFKEFSNYECDFKDCMHIKEKNCKVLKAVSEGKILPSRYINYTRFLKECHENNSKLYK